MEIPLYQVDAFASGVFKGNPAAVCPLESWLPDETLQAIAGENNLSETAFFVRENGHYRLRWFTPWVEVDLCGHATLASAWVLYHELGAAEEVLEFHTRSGVLTVAREGSRLALDFPSRPPQEVYPPTKLLDGLKGEPVAVFAARDYMALFESEAEVRALDPDMKLLAKVDRFAVIATAPGDDCDFVSRFFAPARGVDEDPVTGSAHCTLIPFWAERLGKTKLFARQVSRRGGELWCELLGDRVKIAGEAALYLKGTIHL
jgi:predicted PhzF superfamily epimerase YddE/YHI9